MTHPRHTFRMADDTAEEFRVYAAELALEARASGGRVTQPTAFAAILAVARKHKKEVIEQLAKEGEATQE
jgi:hypothetical protein